MRIPSGVTDQYVYFVAVDATDFTTRETGLSSFTVYRSRNGAAAAAMTTPTINEVDATNMPGVYELLLDEDMTIGAGNDTEEMVFHITHAGMAPVTRTVELYRPKITVGSTLDASGAGLTAIPWNSAWDAEVQSEAADALTAYDPPTKAELDSAFTEIKGATWSSATDTLEHIRDKQTDIETDTAEIGVAGAGLTEAGGNGDHLTEAGGTGDHLTAVPWNAAWDAEVQSEAQDAIEANNLDHLVGTATGIPAVPAGTFLDQIMDDGTSSYDRTTDSLQAIRDRGDAAWTTGGGGSITDILNVHAVIPFSIDLANTATVRLGLMLTNAVDDLPSTAEITPGTISIERKAIGGTSWSAVVTDAACSEQAGLIYYDEVFDSGTGYAEGDSIRVTFKSQKITVSANDYEVTDANGVMFQTHIRETMRGTDSAYTGTPPTAAAIRSEIDSNSTQLAAIIADTNGLQGDWADGGRLDLLIDAIKAVTDALPDSGALTSLAQASALTTVDTNVDAIKAITDAIGATAAANLARALGSAAVVAGTVDTVTNTHTPTTTEFQADDITEATADHYNGRVVIFLTGALAGQATDITDYSAVGGIGQFTVTALTEAPSNNDTFIIV